MLGAAGAWMGTRFVASREWGGGSGEQRAVLVAGADDTVRTLVFDLVRSAPFPDGSADRVLRNAVTDAWHGREAAIAKNRAELQRELAESAQSDPAARDAHRRNRWRVRRVDPVGRSSCGDRPTNRG